jgi:hypothetical protein
MIAATAQAAERGHNAPSCRLIYRGRSLIGIRKTPIKSMMFGGWGGIRTHGRLAPPPVFKTGALNRSATHPQPRDGSGAQAADQVHNSRQTASTLLFTSLLHGSGG